MTPYQTQKLMESYKAKPCLEQEEKLRLAKSLNIDEKRIRHWFAQRRCWERKRGMLRERD